MYRLKLRKTWLKCINTRLKVHQLGMCTQATKCEPKDETSRLNPLNIQMLSDKLHRKIFGIGTAKIVPNEVLKEVKSHLKDHDLLNKSTSIQENVTVDLPPLYGNTIDEHFKHIATEQSKDYVAEAHKLAENSLPPIPKKWLYERGWTRYGSDGSVTKVDYPEDAGLVFDVEVLMNEGDFPTMATAASSNAWYSWCSDRLIEKNYFRRKEPTLSDLIPLETTENGYRKRLVIGHNVGFDRSFIKEQYYIKGPRTRFLDTMSLHIAISGLTSFQRILYVARKSGTRPKEMREHEHEGKIRNMPPTFEWTKETSLNNLRDVHQLYCPDQTRLDKATRDVFVEGNMEDVRTQFQDLMTYCANDVKATHDVFSEVWPIFNERFPHPVTLAGMLEMGSTYLPVNYNWQRYLESANDTYNEYQRELNLILTKLANNACELVNSHQYKEDLWLWDLDWSVRELKMKAEKPKKKKKNEKTDEDKTETIEERVHRILELSKRTTPKRLPHMPGYPKWYAELCPKLSDICEETPPGPSLITTQRRLTPKLLRLTWDGYPIHYNDTHGWGYLIPRIYEEEDILKDGEAERESVFPLHKLREFCWKLIPNSTSPQSDSEVQKQVMVEMLYDKLEASEDDDERIRLWRAIQTEEGKQKKSKSKRSDSTHWHRGNGPYDIGLPGCDFFKLPHKDGAANRVGNPLSKDFLSKIEEGTLKSAGGSEANAVLRLSKMCSFWKNNQDRITSQMTLPLKEEYLPKAVSGDDLYDSGSYYGAILPRVVTAGTVTRRAVEKTWLTASNATADRIGSEMKAVIQSPPGYHFVGADVDSQELWIAALLGDAHFARLHGCTAFGWMTLQGNKKDKTDLHSKTAAIVDISRDQAKIFNYGRIYGAGQTFAERLLMQFNHRLKRDQAKAKAKAMYMATKGKKIRSSRNGADAAVSSKWKGGSESYTFNMLEEIAKCEHPRTPVLDCMISKSLEPRNVSTDFMTSRINWVVQSSAVDYLHLMLVCMRWLFEKYDIDGRFAISIHDEVRYLVNSEDRYRAALALQFTNLLTRSIFAYKLGFDDLPQSVAFFSAVDVDKCMRKEVNIDCVTPSNPWGMKTGYDIQYGEALSIYDILEKTGGKL